MRKKTESYRLVVGSTAARKVLASSLDFITQNSIGGHVKQGNAALNSFIKSHLHWFVPASFLNLIQKRCWRATLASLRDKMRNMCDDLYIYTWIYSIANSKAFKYLKRLLFLGAYTLSNVLSGKCGSKVSVSKRRNPRMQYLV